MADRPLPRILGEPSQEGALPQVLSASPLQVPQSASQPPVSPSAAYEKTKPKAVCITTVPDTAPSGGAGAHYYKKLNWNKKKLKVYFDQKNIPTNISTTNILEWANEWSRSSVVHGLKGVTPEFVLCNEELKGESDIRVEFKSQGGSWSFIGTEAQSHQDEATMVLNLAVRKKKEYCQRYTVIHEFGHALGLGHEHQTSRLRGVIDREAMINFLTGPTGGMTVTSAEEKVENDYALQSETPQRAHREDAFALQSVMCYLIPLDCILESCRDQFTSDESLKSLTAVNHCYYNRQTPSQFDIETIRELYSSGFPKLCGVDVIGQTSFTVTNKAQIYHWEGYGVKLYIPQDSLPADYPQCEVGIKASVSGQYKFPGELVSGVYWIYCPVKLCKHVRLEVQHCSEQTEGLRFVQAECTQEQLPYNFCLKEETEEFPDNSYGSISLSEFFGLAIGLVNITHVKSMLSRSSQFYSAQVLYSSNHLNTWIINFVFFKVESQTEFKVLYKAIERQTGFKILFHDAPSTFEFASDSIKLLLPRNMTNWTILTPSSLEIEKKAVDQSPLTQPSMCQLCFECYRCEVAELNNCTITLTGAKQRPLKFNLKCGPNDIPKCDMISDPERINFYRVGIIILEHVPKVLRQVLKERVLRVHMHTWDNTCESGKWMSEVMKVKERNKSEKELIRNGDITKWDTSLLTFALLHKNLDLVNGTEYEAIDDVRELRNDFAHGEAKASDVKLQHYIKTVESMDKSLDKESEVADLRHIETMPITYSMCEDMNQRWQEVQTEFDKLYKGQQEIKEGQREIKEGQQEIIKQLSALWSRLTDNASGGNSGGQPLGDSPSVSGVAGALLEVNHQRSQILCEWGSLVQSSCPIIKLPDNVM